MRTKETADVKALLHSPSCHICLATSDREGRVDIAPVGSTFLSSPDTIACLRGPLARTYSNLRENPEAVFLVSNVSRARWFRFFLTGEFRAPFGYRIHARLREERPLTEAEKDRILKKRFGPIARGRGARKIADTLRQILLFDVLEVRDVVPFGGSR
ncbi:MAG: pyridoxamine 5'-phosphate oxidase family protein [Deltaproteobacteria bacterium]|nr:pyridoxamine 5'-phosphate oxidase family protein [Deltaproteobacteria bacterium]